MGKAGRPPTLYTHTIDGERRSLTLTQWASALNIQPPTVRRAAHRAGRSVNDEIAVQITRRAALAPTAPQTPQATSGAAASPTLLRSRRTPQASQQRRAIPRSLPPRDATRC